MYTSTNRDPADLPLWRRRRPAGQRLPDPCWAWRISWWYHRPERRPCTRRSPPCGWRPGRVHARARQWSPADAANDARSCSPCVSSCVAPCPPASAAPADIIHFSLQSNGAMQRSLKLKGRVDCDSTVNAFAWMNITFLLSFLNTWRSTKSRSILFINFGIRETITEFQPNPQDFRTPIENLPYE